LIGFRAISCGEKAVRVNNSGASAHSGLPAALEKILRDRGLSAPHGRPLYSYRFTPDEIAVLKQRLTQVLAWAGPTCLDTRWCAQAFVVIASSWLCGWRGEGVWGYAPLCAELGLKYHQDHWQAVTAGIREGLRGWGRRVRRNEDGGAEYLASLICEGGLPLRAIQGGRWLTQWLQGTLDLVARGVFPDQAAAQEAWRVPATFREHLIPVAAELAARLHQIKQDLASADRAGLDAIAWLDLNRTGWRDTLPLYMGDEDARSLIEGVVRHAERGAAGDIGVERGLQRGTDGVWDFTIEIPLDGLIEHTRLPQDLSSRLMGKLRARIRPAGDLLALFSGDLGIMESYEEDEVLWWRIRPLRRVVNLRCPPGLRVDLAVEADGAPLGNFILSDAQGLTPEPLAFLLNPDDPNRLALAARGSYITRLPQLIIAAPHECRPLFNLTGGSILPIGRTREFDLELYRLEGELRLELDGQTYRWRTGSERETLAVLELDGTTEPDVRGLAWKQPLRLYVREGSSRRQARAGEVKWRPARGGRWRTWPEECPRGDVIFVLVRNGVVASRATAAVAPSGFSTAAISGARRELAIRGLQGASVTIAGTSKTDRSAHTVTVERFGGAGSHVDLDAIWPDGTSWRTELYDRTARPGFTDSAGAELPPGWRGCIDALFGVYASCPDRGKLALEIVSAPSTRCIMRPVRRETPLFSLRADIRTLMATTSRLDATVRLQWVGAGGHHIDIGLFDVALEVHDGEVWPSYADLARVAASHATRVTLLATPMAAPSEEYLLADGELPTYRLRRFSLPSAGPGGPWLVYGRVDDRFRIRPRVVVTRSAPERQWTRLHEMVLSADTATRRQNLTRLLNSDQLTDHELEEARRLIVSFQPRTPLQSLDLAAALIDAPATAVRLLLSSPEAEVDMVLALEQEMNFLWGTTPVHAWREAFEWRKAHLVKLMSALPAQDAERYAGGELESVLQAIVARLPALAFHVFSVTGGRIETWLTEGSKEANNCVARNGHAEDGVIWPTDGNLATRLGTDLPRWIQNKQPYCWNVLAAPLIAARVAAGLVPWGQTLTGALCWARLFDPVYFDRMLPTALLTLGTRSATHA
jgi:hypothetical protein